MDEQAVYANLGPIFRAVFERDDISVTPGLTAHDVPGWDSFRQIELLIAMETTFGFKFTAREIDGLENVGDAVAVILRHKATG